MLRARVPVLIRPAPAPLDRAPPPAGGLIRPPPPPVTPLSNPKTKRGTAITMVENPPKSHGEGYTQRLNHGGWVNPSSKMGEKGSTNVYPDGSRWSENGLFMRFSGIVVRGLQMYTNVYPTSKTRKNDRFSQWSERGKPFKKAKNGVNPDTNHDGRF